MLHARELADRIDLTTGAKTCIFNPDGVFGIHTMLDAYDQARVNAKGHEIEVSHGPVAEALFRKWLSDFLPKRYGVTSGFIVSQGEKEDVRLPHLT